MNLILASSSENRRNLFDMVGFDYEVITSKEKEYSNKKDPDEFVKELSLIKATSVANQISKKAVIVACDSVIYLDNKIYEKPKTQEEAKKNLLEMNGKTVYSVTGLTIKDLYQNKTITVSDTCKVTFKDISIDDVDWYIENEKTIYDRCGFAIQGKAAFFIDKVEGDFNTLIGISLSQLNECLKELGYKLSDFKFKK